MDQLVACIRSKLPVLTCTLQLREEFKQEVTGTAGLLHVEDPNWPGIGAVRYGFSGHCTLTPVAVQTPWMSHCEPA